MSELEDNMRCFAKVVSSEEHCMLFFYGTAVTLSHELRTLASEIGHLIYEIYLSSRSEPFERVSYETPLKYSQR